MLSLPLPHSPFQWKALQPGTICQVKFSEQNHKVLVAAWISILGTREKERSVMWKVEKIAILSKNANLWTHSSHVEHVHNFESFNQCFFSSINKSFQI